MDDNACINPVSTLSVLVNTALTAAMIALIPLLMAAAPVAGDPPMHRPVIAVATASVTIIRAEAVVVKPLPFAAPQTDRQYRKRDSVPLVEFF
jgi:hypothetical protein